MAITLKSGEEIKAEVNFHWSAFILAKAWAVLGVIASFGAILSLFGDDPEKTSSPEMFIWIGLLFYGPLTYKWLQNKCKRYVLTNQRVYIEEGVISKSKTDLPLNKLNDVALKQNILQRLFGSGTIILFTGNSKPNLIKDVENPDEFKNAISDMIENRSKAS